ncbi:hypothetical protein GCM10027262_32810 [Nocardia tengchongensis]
MNRNRGIATPTRNSGNSRASTRTPTAPSAPFGIRTTYRPLLSTADTATLSCPSPSNRSSAHPNSGRPDPASILRTGPSHAPTRECPLMSTHPS